MDVRIIVPVLHSNELAGKARLEYQACASPGVKLSVACVANGTYSIESEYDMALAQPEVMRLVRDAERDGADACMITCFGDPGATGAKELVKIPVVGEGEAALHMASLLGGRFSIMITQRELFPMMRRLALQVGMEHRLASVRAVGAGVLDFNLDLVPRAIDEAEIAVREDGADVIVMGCTGTGIDMAVRIEELLAQRVGAYVPVIDPVKATMKLTEALVATSMTHSKVAYPTPPDMRAEYQFAGAEQVRRLRG